MKKIIVSVGVLVVLLISITSIAFAAGELSDFQAERLEAYKVRLEAAVEDGRLTQTEADERYEAKLAFMEDRAENCDGTCDGTRDRLCDGTCDGTGEGQNIRTRQGGFGAGIGQGEGTGMGSGGLRKGGGTGVCPN